MTSRRGVKLLVKMHRGRGNKILWEFEIMILSLLFKSASRPPRYAESYRARSYWDMRACAEGSLLSPDDEPPRAAAFTPVHFEEESGEWLHRRKSSRHEEIIIPPSHAATANREIKERNARDSRRHLNFTTLRGRLAGSSRSFFFSLSLKLPSMIPPPCFCCCCCCCERAKSSKFSYWPQHWPLYSGPIKAVGFFFPR